MHRPLRTAFVGSTCLLLALAGCKQEEAQQTTPPAATPAPAAPVAVSSVNLGKSLGPDKRVVSETTQFGTMDTIYASVSTSGSGSGSLTARWTFQDGQVVDETTQPISATGPATTEFHIAKPSGWPAGNYKVEVSLNGSAGQSKDFSVR
jgi:hypothetical protein